MERENPEISTSHKACFKDITESDIELETITALFPDRQGLYDGPGAKTLTEITEMGQVGFRLARKKIAEQVNNGELVAVKVRREDALGRLMAPLDAYVLKRIYDWWEANRSRDEI